MKEFIKTNKTYIIVLAVLFVFVTLSETTYSLFIKSNSTDEFNYNTGLLDLQFTEDEQISLGNVFPINDSDGVKTEPYNLTIKNTGSVIYLFDLKMLSNEVDNVIDSKYIKVKVNDGLPHTLASTNNTLANNVIIYPNEEITFRINIWLDIDTPNNELGKKFIAKAITSGSGIYKTLDNSGANHPKMLDNMLPVYYDENLKTWKKADKSNMVNDSIWYNYDDGKWANVVTIKNSDKQIYDLTGKHNIKVDNLIINNGNLIIEDKPLELNVDYNFNNITTIMRVKVSELNNNIYFLSNDNISLYYDITHKAFIFKNGSNTISTDTFDLEKNKWYILGYTYDGNTLSLYIDGNKMTTSNITGSIGSSFKLGADNSSTNISKITVGDVLFYNKVLSDNDINNYYSLNMNILYDSLEAGYSNFTPMTLKEYYLASNNGVNIANDDIISMYVWIPRFKYRVFNILGEANTDSYGAYHKGIEVAFENLTASSGNIYCEGTECYSDNLKTTKVTSDDNGKYYTHPAFTTTTSELTGLWVSKYEVSNGMQSKNANEVLVNENLSTYYQQIKSIDDSNDYHVIKNTEWGSIVYLTHSKYGLCKNNTCSSIVNNNTKISGKELKDSTTGNIYGVFDISGSANEYTMGNISSSNTLNLDNSYFNEVPVGTDDYDLYSVNTFILGDATKELSLGNNNWNNSTNTINENTNWIIRNNLYGYGTSNDVKDENLTTRIVIK